MEQPWFHLVVNTSLSKCEEQSVPCWLLRLFYLVICTSKADAWWVIRTELAFTFLQIIEAVAISA